MPLPFAVSLGRSLIKDAFKSQKKEQKKDAAQKAKPKVSGPKITEKFLGTKPKEEKTDTPTTKYKPPSSSPKMGETGIESVDKSLTSIQESIISLRKSLKSSSDFTIKQKRKKRVTEEVEDQRKEEEQQENKAKKMAEGLKKKIGSKLAPGISAVKNFFIQIMIGSFLLWLKKNAEEITKQVKEFAEKVEEVFTEINDNVIQPLWDLSKSIIGPILTEVTKIVLPNFDQENKDIEDKLSALVKEIPFVGKEIQKIEDAIRSLKVNIPEDKLKQGQQQAQQMSGKTPSTTAPATTSQTTTTSSTSPPSQTSTAAEGTYSTASLSGASQSRVGGDQAFLNEVTRISKKFQIRESDLLGLLASESGMNPQANNGTHVGLIQFSADSAAAVGTTQQALLGMNRAQQMKYVEKYFDYWNLPKGASAGQLYSIVFAPAYASKDNNKVLYTSPSAAYRDNAALDANGDGKITVGEMGKRIEDKKREFGIADNVPPSQVAPASAPSSAAIVQYITGDKTYKGGLGQDSFVDVAGHGTQATYHEHVSFKDRATAVRAYKFLTSRGIQVTEFEGYTRVGSHSARGGHFGPVGGAPTYDDKTDGTAFDIPGSQWGGTGAIGETDYAGSRKVRKLLNDFLIQEAGGKVNGQANGVSANTQYERQGGGTVVVPVNSGGANQMMSGPTGGSTSNPPTQGSVNNNWWSGFTNIRLFKGG